MSNIVISLSIFTFHLKVTNNFVIKEKQTNIATKVHNFKPLDLYVTRARWFHFCWIQKQGKKFVSEDKQFYALYANS